MQEGRGKDRAEGERMKMIRFDFEDEVGIHHSVYVHGTGKYRLNEYDTAGQLMAQYRLKTKNELIAHLVGKVGWSNRRVHLVVQSGGYHPYNIPEDIHSQMQMESMFEWTRIC